MTVVVGPAGVGGGVGAAVVVPPPSPPPQPAKMVAKSAEVPTTRKTFMLLL